MQACIQPVGQERFCTRWMATPGAARGTAAVRAFPPPADQTSARPCRTKNPLPGTPRRERSNAQPPHALRFDGVRCRASQPIEHPASPFCSGAGPPPASHPPFPHPHLSTPPPTPAARSSDRGRLAVRHDRRNRLDGGLGESLLERTDLPGSGAQGDDGIACSGCRGERRAVRDFAGDRAAPHGEVIVL